jgi:hypothetical protein
MIDDGPCEEPFDPAVEPKVKEIECESWSDFSKVLHAERPDPLYVLYRGQSNATWPLVPPSQRGRYNLLKKLGKTGSTYPARDWEGPWKQFKYLATGMPGVVLPGTDLEVQALARHHGVVSNLLDWSKSPYVAAFFAFVDLAEATARKGVHTRVEEDRVAVWGLSHEDLERSGELEVLTAQSSINYWQKAQAGHFTRLTKPPYLDLARYLESVDELDRLRKIVIPASEMYIALRDLEDMNITYDRLWPDFGGAARRANLGYNYQLGALMEEHWRRHPASSAPSGGE